MQRSRYAWLWLVGGTAAQSLFWLAASFDTHAVPDTVWSLRPLMLVLSMTLLLLAAFLMHRRDEPNTGWGFRHVHQHYGGHHEPDEQKYVPSVLTGESIRVATTTLILAALLEGWRRHFPDTLPTPPPAAILVQEPRTFFFAVIVAALASSIVTTMAALLCYEYASRFKWRESWPKIEFLDKALDLGRFGFYCLMWSLAVIPALVDYRLALASILLVFVTMWFYYFFPLPDRRPVAERMQADAHSG